MDKYISVITNFGCHYKCPYCIVKENGLKIPKTTVKGLDMLERAIEEHNCNWVSVSGGGDPLFNWEEHKDWYTRFLTITGAEKIELHTSYLDAYFPYNIFDRVVYHAHTYDDLKRIKRRGNQIVRVVYVVTEDFTTELIDKIAKFVKDSTEIDELSFRQMVNSNYQSTDYCKEYLEAGHQKDWWYIQQCDYNIYYCENKVSYRFEDFEKED